MRLPRRALAGGEREPVPALDDVVAGGRDPAGVRVAEVDAGDGAVDGQRRLAGQRPQHVAELERGVQRPRGPHERLVLTGARPGAGLGLEPGQPGRGGVGEGAGGGLLVVGELAALVEDRDRHVAHLAAPAHRHEQRGGRVEALDDVLAHLDAGGGVDDVERGVRRHHAGRAGRTAVVEHLDVAGVLAALLAHDVRVAGAGALGDLDEQHAADGERLVERARQRRVDLVEPGRGRRGAGEPLLARRDRARGGIALDVGSGGSGDRVGNGGASLERGFTTSIGRPVTALDAVNRPRCGIDAGFSRRRGSARRSPRTAARRSRPAGPCRSTPSPAAPGRWRHRCRCRWSRSCPSCRCPCWCWARSPWSRTGCPGRWCRRARPWRSASASASASAARAGVAEGAGVRRDRHVHGRARDLLVVDLAATAADDADGQGDGAEQGCCGSSRAHEKDGTSGEARPYGGRRSGTR